MGIDVDCMVPLRSMTLMASTLRSTLVQAKENSEVRETVGEGGDNRTSVPSYRKRDHAAAAEKKTISPDDGMLQQLGWDRLC